MKRRWREWLRNLRWPALLIALTLLWFSVRSVGAAAVWAQLRTLTITDLMILALANVIVLATFSARWWILLRAQGYSVPYHKLMGYRLAAFAVSYFTPGPQIGGEPLQGYAVTSRHAVPAPASAAAVLLDKAFEMIAGFIFLLGGLLFVVQPGLLPANVRGPLLGSGAGLLLLPAALIAALAAGRRPVSGGWDAWATLWARLRGRRLATTYTLGRAYQSVRAAEAQSSVLCRSHPLWWAAAIVATLLSWLAIMAEFWLMARILGLGLDFGQAMMALVAMRWAVLLPLPAGLGALEASLVLAAGALGIDPAAGLSMALLIRSRDLLLGLAGLGIAAGLLRRKPALIAMPAPVSPK
jgi:uncharacterized membrane protein YbhN (UPF0104 family)